MVGKDLEKILAVAVSKYVLKRLPGEEVPSIALAVLEEGVENDEILELAGAEDPSFSEIETLFTKALEKLGVQMPDVRQATVCLAKELSEKIISGDASPYEGAKQIWWELSSIEGADERLKIFAGLASEYEDAQSDNYREDYERQILEEARNVVDDAFR